MRKSLVIVLVSLGAALGTSADQSRPSGWDLRVTTVDSPAMPSSGQPHLAVSARGLLMSWVEREGSRATLKFAERTATGWTVPRAVASGDNWFVNWADVPSVLRLPGGTLVGHWLQKSGPGTYAYDVRLAYSTNDGRTFSPSFLPHHDGTQTEHGFVSMFPAGRGLGLVWLDGRQMQTGPQAAMDHSGGAMTLRYGAFDGAWKQTADMAIDLRVCECCPTTAAMTADGPVVAYRNRSDAEIRDIYVSRLENGKWTEGKPVAEDNWHITGCPVNGPMLAARGRDVALAWFTGKENQNRAFIAFSKDAGKTFGPPIRVDDESTLGRVDVEWLDDGAAIVSWIERPPAGAEFRVRRIEPNGNRSPSVAVSRISTDRTSGYPRIARHGNELLMAWVEVGASSAGNRSNQTQVRVAAARVPGLSK